MSTDGTLDGDKVTVDKEELVVRVDTD